MKNSLLITCLFVPFLLVSCGSFNLFKKTAEPVSPPIESEHVESESVTIEEFESELASVKSDQTLLENRLQEKNTQIEELKTKVRHLEQKLEHLEKANKKPKKIKKESVTPNQLYNQARNLLLEEDYTNAAALFQRFIDTHPKDSLADNSYYWLAECHYSKGNYKDAIDVFKSLERNYPKSEKVPDAILKVGYSYMALDDTNRAHHFLKTVLKKYPFSPAAEKAHEKLSEFE